MIVAIIILLIGLIGSVLFNILLSSSKNSCVSQIKKIQKENKELKSDNAELKNLVGQQENKIKTYEEALKSAEHQKKESDSHQIELKKENDELRKQNKELQSNLNVYRNQISHKEKRISELEKTIKDLTDGSRKPDGSGNLDIAGTPDASNVPTDSNVIQFKDGEFSETLKRISDVSVITEYLKKSSHEKAQRYLKQVKAYAEEIEELEDAFARLDEDEDEISSECIGKLSKVFKEYMAENVIEPVFKAKDEENFYSELYKVIIEYVSKCGIYTKNVTVGSKFENINFMEVITENTTDPTKHKIISRVLRLPFYAKYTSETGKVREKLLSKGSCVVLKAK